VTVVARSDRPADRGPEQLPRTSAISVRGVSKSFKLPHQQYHTLKERVLHPYRSRSFDTLRAVQDVNLEVAPGEFFGVVGRNGSGKSTLLKCLAGIYDVDQGEIAIDGRLSPFIELGVGFNPDLTARDNVIINAIMLGLSRRQARERFDDIVAFAELQEFIDLKLKNYSSGMYVRLAFATAVQVDADILLIDEVLAVGDTSFQQKCFDEFTRLQRAGRTLVFVTHDMSAVQRFCDRAMLLDRGEVVDIGDPVSIARQYNQKNFRSSRIEAGVPDELIPPENSPVQVRNAWFAGADGEPLVTIAQSERCSIRMSVHFLQALENPIFSFAVVNEAGQSVFSSNTDAERITTGRFAAGADAQIKLEFDAWLAPGRYRLFASVVHGDFDSDVLDAHVSSSIIVAGRSGGGLAEFPHTLEIERH
jgi:ABC-type polysaccharide/polyol phosphate transport system ATPase subunit